MYIPDSLRLRARDLEALSGIRRAYIQRVLHIKNGYPQSVKKATDGVQFEVVLYYKHALFRAPNFHMENFKAYLEPYQFAVPLHYSLYLYTQSTLTWNGVYRIQVLNCALTHRSLCEKPLEVCLCLFTLTKPMVCSSLKDPRLDCQAPATCPAPNECCRDKTVIDFRYSRR